MYRSLFLIIGVMWSHIIWAQMSDSQVVYYVKEAQKAGKTEVQLIQELGVRGVTKAQIERIKEQYEADNASVATADASQAGGRSSSFANHLDGEPVKPLPHQEEAMGKHIFGRNVFSGKNLTFEPNMNMATPENYQLGPGDEVIIHVWGANEAVMRHVIAPEGDIVVNNIGPIYLSGLTVKEANEHARRELSKIYGNINAADNASQVRLTLGQIRTIQINVMGEVAVPGTYRLSSFASLFHAIYCAGGINSIGSLRNMMLLRNNRCISVFDTYDMILDGKVKDDVRLMDGDLILVPPYDMMVSVEGKVKRSMYFEVKQGETIDHVLQFAGNFSGDAYKRSVRVVRGKDTEYKLFTVDEDKYDRFGLEDGDAIMVGSILDRFDNRVEVRGAVWRDGMYELSGELNTVRQLIDKAEGLKGDAFLNRAQLFREYDDLTREVIPIHLKALMDGDEADIPLMRNDVLLISSAYEIQEHGNLVISGHVASPGTYPFAENTTLEDLILQAGGLLESASMVHVDISRRIKDPKSSESSSKLSKIYTFSVKDGLVIEGEEGFVLEPYDYIVVRRSPGYQVQRNVTVRGEVVFDGVYTLTKKNERLSDLVKRAKGLTSDAYPEGARLLRKMNEEERAVQAMALQMATRQLDNDSIMKGTLLTSDTYSVGIELDRALLAPKSDYDVVLREGDELIIPEYQSTVRISGVVMYPNTVFYKKGEKLSYYINRAGGYGYRAKKNKVYIVYMNGTVSKVKKFKRDTLQPGCEIIVPSKKAPKNMDALAAIMSIASSTASVATMAAVIANMSK